jgi:hypothetical protein
LNQYDLAHLLEVYIVGQLVFHVNTNNFEAAGRVKNTNINFMIEQVKLSQSGVNEIVFWLEVYILSQLHVFRVNMKNFKVAGGVRNTNVDFAIEPAKSSQRKVNGIGSICSYHDYNI